MRSVSTIEGTAYPLGRENIDTDTILAADWLKVTSREGLGIAAFERLRTEPGNVFEDARYARSPILIAGANFGCGSSREHAVWAMLDMGIQAVVAPSFSDIFRGNALKNGMLSVQLPVDACRILLEVARDHAIRINLPDQVVTVPDGRCFHFSIDAFRKQCLIMGLNEIDLTLGFDAAIGEFEARTCADRPWLSPARRPGA